MNQSAPLHCPMCTAKLFDGHVIKGVTVLKMAENGGFSGMCKRCKNWVRLPLMFSSDNIKSGVVSGF